MGVPVDSLSSTRLLGKAPASFVNGEGEGITKEDEELKEGEPGKRE